MAMGPLALAEYKHIVRGVSAKVHAGQVFAIMGPSGAGKTTLLNSLTQESFGGVARGTITLNGEELDSKSFRQRCCVVAQQDNHWAFLRCRETVDYAARLYLPELTAEQRAAHVDDMVAKMGLLECANTRVGNQFVRGLSGGQKRRLSLAVALIKNPDVMFLDEPSELTHHSRAASLVSPPICPPPRRILFFRPIRYCCWRLADMFHPCVAKSTLHPTPRNQPLPTRTSANPHLALTCCRPHLQLVAWMLRQR